MIAEFTKFSKRKNSTAIPGSFSVSYNCKIKDRCDLVAPVLLIAQTPEPEYNYARVGSRYYYVRSVVIQPSGFCEVSLEPDVLATYRTEIGASQNEVLRSSYEWDGTIRDGLYPALAEVVYSTGSQVTGDYTPAGGSYIVGVRSAVADRNRGVSYYALDEENMDALSKWLNSPAGLSSIFDSIAATIDGLNKSMYNVFEYLVSCMYVPFNLAGSVESVFVGAVNSGVVGTLLDDVSVHNFTVTIPKHPQMTRLGDWVLAEPFSSYKVLLPGSGFLGIDSQFLLGIDSVKCTLYLDHATGTGTWMIADANGVTDPRELRYSSTLGVKIALSYNERADTGIVTGLGRLAAGIMSGPIGGAAALGSTIFGASDPGSIKGSNGSYSEMLASIYCAVFGQFQTLEEAATQTEGRPLMKTRTISDVPGYIQCRNAQLSVSCYAQEYDQIISYMEGGFFYE